MNSRKVKQRNKCRKNITGLKNKNHKKEKRKKKGRRKKRKGGGEENTELQKSTIEAEVFNKNKKM